MAHTLAARARGAASVRTLTPLARMVPVAWTVLVLVGGCGRSDAPAPSAAARPAGTRADTNTVSIPLDSPQAKQIRVERVRAVDMPADEVVAPGR